MGLRSRIHRIVTARARFTADLSGDDWLEQLGRARKIKRNIDDEAVAKAHSITVDEDGHWPFLPPGYLR